jgi:hypothetical protein
VRQLLYAYFVIAPSSAGVRPSSPTSRESSCRTSYPSAVFSSRIFICRGYDQPRHLSILQSSFSRPFAAQWRRLIVGPAIIGCYLPRGICIDACSGRCSGGSGRCQCRAGRTPIAVAKSGVEGGGSERCLGTRLRVSKRAGQTGQKRAVGTPRFLWGRLWWQIRCIQGRRSVLCASQRAKSEIPDNCEIRCGGAGEEYDAREIEPNRKSRLECAKLRLPSAKLQPLPMTSQARSPQCHDQSIYQRIFLPVQMLSYRTHHSPCGSQ